MSPPHRPGRSVRLLALALFSAALPTSTHAGELHVRIDSLPCDNPDRIESAIRRSLSRPLAQQPDLTLVVASAQPPPADAPSAPEVLLRMEGPATSAERRLTLEDRSCRDLPSLVKLLVRGWLDRRWTAPLPRPADPLPPDEPDPPEEPQARAPVPSLSTASIAPLDSGRPHSPSPLRALLLAGMFRGAGELNLGPTLAAALDLDLFPHAGLCLRAGHQGPRTARLPPGEVTARIAHFDLLARASLPLAPSGFLELLAGPSLAIAFADSAGYSSEAHHRATTAAFVAGAHWRQQLNSRARF